VVTAPAHQRTPGNEVNWRSIVRRRSEITRIRYEEVSTLSGEPRRAPRIARALTLLIDEINATPPAMPGDTRPITYQLTPRPGI
jgi:hypothetical protein